MPEDLQNFSPGQLAHYRNNILHHFDRIETEFDHRRGQNRLLVKAEQIQWEDASAVHPVTQEGHRLARIISPELGFNIHSFRVFKRQIGGGGVDGAFHTHGDAVKFYLEGGGKEIIGETEYEVKAGDLAFIPANIWHGTENTGQDPMVFIAFHQLPGTHLPVPASWQYPQADMVGKDDLAVFLESVQDDDLVNLDSAALYSRRQHFLHYIGVLDDEFNRRRQEHRYVITQDEVPQTLPADQQSQALIAPELGYDIYAMQLSIRIVPPNYRDGSQHRHGEAVHYHISGTGQLQVGDQKLTVEPGDLSFVPAGADHQIINTSDQPLKYLIAEQMPGIYLQRPVSWSAPD